MEMEWKIFDKFDLLFLTILNPKIFIWVRNKIVKLIPGKRLRFQSKVNDSKGKHNIAEIQPGQMKHRTKDNVLIKKSAKGTFFLSFVVLFFWISDFYPKI